MWSLRMGRQAEEIGGGTWRSVPGRTSGGGSAKEREAVLPTWTAGIVAASTTEAMAEKFVRRADRTDGGTIGRGVRTASEFGHEASDTKLGRIILPLIVVLHMYRLYTERGCSQGALENRHPSRGDEDPKDYGSYRKCATLQHGLT